VVSKLSVASKFLERGHRDQEGLGCARRGSGWFACGCVRDSWKWKGRLMKKDWVAPLAEKVGSLSEASAIRGSDLSST
jgi:hypothetical protein